MQFDLTIRRAAAPPGSRAPRRRQRVLARRHLPPLDLVPGHDEVDDDAPPSAGELVADLMALIDAGFVVPIVGENGASAVARYAAIEPERQSVVLENVPDMAIDPFTGGGTIADAADGERCSGEVASDPFTAGRTVADGDQHSDDPDRRGDLARGHRGDQGRGHRGHRVDQGRGHRGDSDHRGGDHDHRVDHADDVRQIAAAAYDHRNDNEPEEVPAA
jgi:hypothetical protein